MKHHFAWLAALLTLSAPAEPAGPAPAAAPETTIRSDSLVMEAGETGSRFVFSGNVSIEAENLRGFAEELVVITAPPGADAPGIGPVGAILQIEAVGNVRIEQAGRVAAANRAVILPGEGEISLEDGAVVRDIRGTVEGYRIVIRAGDRDVRVFPYPNGDQQLRVTVPSLRDLGFNPDQPETRP